jgi:hypothetical protein
MDGLRRLIVERLMQARAIVEGDIPPQTADRLRNAPVIVELYKPRVALSG